MWDDQVPAFAARHRVVRYDLRGFGASSPPALGEPYTHADDLSALLTHLGIARATVVGLSMGGWVAQDFALAHPAALRALVLVDSYVRRYPFGPGLVGTLERLYRLGREGRLAEARAGWLAVPLFAGSHRDPAVAARLERIVADYSGWHLRHDDPHRPPAPPAIERL